ncbi:hypothetical protein C8J56DRAFT_1036622 [Mycena floridula]|nr:hypothetical protein C8J56DRAFT_1036622 [Mycena floridula]
MTRERRGPATAQRLAAASQKWSTSEFPCDARKQSQDEASREEKSKPKRQVTMTTKTKAWMTRNLKALGDAGSGGPWTTQDLEDHWTMQDDPETIRPRAEFVTKPTRQRRIQEQKEMVNIIRIRSEWHGMARGIILEVDSTETIRNDLVFSTDVVVRASAVSPKTLLTVLAVSEKKLSSPNELLLHTISTSNEAVLTVLTAQRQPTLHPTTAFNDPIIIIDSFWSIPQYMLFERPGAVLFFQDLT